MDDVEWKTSPWDHHVHAFAAGKIGEVGAEAVCEHTARSSALTDPEQRDPKCMGCLLIVGDQLADRLEQQIEQRRDDPGLEA